MKKTKPYDVERTLTRKFKYPYLRVDLNASLILIQRLKSYDFKMCLNLGTILQRNTNVILNVLGEPAQNMEEIATSMGYGSTAAPITALRHLFELDVIRKIKDRKYFRGYAYIVNPYVMTFGKSMKDEIYAAFNDTVYNVEE